jgi:predicted membrane channel-forming protein YqfA (hemolysin III family)
MYQAYPTENAPQEPQRSEAPQSVRNAIKLMYAGMALEVVALVVAIVFAGSLKSGILTKHPHYTTTQLHHAESARTVPIVIGAVIAIALWFWMARANGRGLPWARTVSAVFFGLSTLALLFSIVTIHATASLIMGVIIWLVGLAAIVLLYSKQSGPFYKQQPAS